MLARRRELCNKRVRKRRWNVPALHLAFVVVFCYDCPMIDTTTAPDVMLSATPREREIQAWQALPRDEQLRRMRAALSDPDCGKVSPATMDDVHAAGRALAAKLRNG